MANDRDRIGGRKQEVAVGILQTSGKQFMGMLEDSISEYIFIINCLVNLFGYLFPLDIFLFVQWSVFCFFQYHIVSFQ